MPASTSHSTASSDYAGPSWSTSSFHDAAASQPMELAALGEHGSLKHAAEMMGMSQPAASKLLLEAESLVGASLYERTNRGVVPTAAGAALVGAVCGIAFA